MSEATHWNERYTKGDTPWDTAAPSSELQRVLREVQVAPGRALELGCGTGNNAVWLAQQGFDVTAADLSRVALERARRRAEVAGVTVHFLEVDVMQPPPALIGPFDFFFDRGCYHAVRREDRTAYPTLIARLTRSGALGLVLTGNACEPHDPGPPTVSEEEIRAELGASFEVVQLRAFRFDEADPNMPRFLGWSCLLRRR